MAFRASGGREPAQVVEAILAQVRAFIGDAPPHDDMTIVALQVSA